MAERFPRCRAEASCDDSAISFSEFCWTHTDKESYLPKLRSEIRALDKKPVVLNLKKVVCDNLDFSHRSLKDSSFSQTHFTNTLFVGAQLAGCDMIGSRFHMCDFVGSDMSGINMTRAVLTHCSFSYANMRDAYLVEAHFRDADLMGTILTNSVIWNSDFSGAKHLKKKNFVDVEGNPKAVFLCEKNVEVAFESYRTLKHYLYEQGLYEDASWAAYRELTMERKHFFQTRNPRYFPSLLMDILSGYTQKPNRVIMTSLLLILFFGLLYYFLGAAEPATGISLGRGMSLFENIYFSFITFTTVGYGDFMPKPVPFFRLLACIEAFSGPFMAGLYIFTLTRRYAAN